MKTKEKLNVATLEINHCEQCQFLDKKRHYTADSFEHEYDWHCTKKKDKKIASYVGIFDSETSKVRIPDWCPLIKK